MRPGANRFDSLRRLHPAAAAVMGVLQANQAGPHQVLVIGPDQPGGELLDPQDAIFALERPRADSAELGIASLFVVKDMRAGLANELVPRPAMDPHGDLI